MVRIENATLEAQMQGASIAAELKTAGLEIDPDSEMVALIAFLQSLGKAAPPVAQTGGQP